LFDTLLVLVIMAFCSGVVRESEAVPKRYCFIIWTCFHKSDRVPGVKKLLEWSLPMVGDFSGWARYNGTRKFLIDRQISPRHLQKAKLLQHLESGALEGKDMGA
jgi:hypothetical protein